MDPNPTETARLDQAALEWRRRLRTELAEQAELEDAERAVAEDRAKAWARQLGLE